MTVQRDVSSPLRWDFHPVQWIKVRMSHGVRETDGKAGCHRGEMEKWNKISFHCRATDCQILLRIRADGFTQRTTCLTYPLKKGDQKTPWRVLMSKPMLLYSTEKVFMAASITFISDPRDILHTHTWPKKHSRALPCVFFFLNRYRTMSNDLISTCRLEIVPVKENCIKRQTIPELHKMS